VNPVNYVAPEDLSTKARIREVALQLFGEQGISSTSLRAVAAAAGMSPGLITHHYGTRANLEEVVAEYVVRRLEDAVRGLDVDPADTASLVVRRQAFDAFLQANPLIARYLERALTERSSASAAPAVRLLASSRSAFEAMVEAGAARPFDDPDMGHALYWLVNSARFLLAPILEARGLDMSDPATIARLRRAEIDLLTRPVFPPSDAAQATPA
jgi:AcrR family transcriptional regulator